MKALLKTLFALGLLALTLLATLVWHSWTQTPLRFEWLLDRMVVEQGLEDPEMLSNLRVLEPWGIRWHNARLTDESLAAGERRAAQVHANLALLHQYDRAALSPARQLSYDVVEWDLAQKIEGERFRFHDQPVNPLFGVQSELPSFLITDHFVGDARDAEDYLTRLKLVETKVDQLLEGLKLRHERQVLPQRFAAEKVIEQMQGFIAPPPAEHVLVTSFAGKLKTVAKLSEVERQAFLTRAADTLQASVYPAYARLIGYFERLLPRLDRNDGAWALPEGEAYYAWCVKRHTSTALTPAQVHAIGVAEVARIDAQMDAILRAQGYVQGTVGVRMLKLGAEPRFNYPDTDAGRAQILIDYQAHIDEIDAGLSPYFNLRPDSKVVVQRVPVFKEKTSPGAYYESPALDRSRPGVFWINLRNVAEIQKFGMRTLAYHEAIPGHHFQIGIAQELPGVPLLQKLQHFTAYTEGWALYAERLAQETGYQKDPYDDLGRLQAEMFRAVRLVVDTGMHQQRWTREQAIDYMIAKTGTPRTDVVAEIERYLIWPGQALAYKIGMNRILELREELRQAQGEAFDLRAFHDLVLDSGAMPLEVLAGRVQAAAR